MKSNGKSCSGFMTFAETPPGFKTGMDSGVHWWSLQWVPPERGLYDANAKVPNCYQSVGVTLHPPSPEIVRECADHWIDVRKNPAVSSKERKIYSYFEGYTKWKYEG